MNTKANLDPVRVEGPGFSRKQKSESQGTALWEVTCDSPQNSFLGQARCILRYVLIIHMFRGEIPAAWLSWCSTVWKEEFLPSAPVKSLCIKLGYSDLVHCPQFILVYIYIAHSILIANNQWRGDVAHTEASAVELLKLFPMLIA